MVWTSETGSGFPKGAGYGAPTGTGAHAAILFIDFALVDAEILLVLAAYKAIFFCSWAFTSNAITSSTLYSLISLQLYLSHGLVSK